MKDKRSNRYKTAAWILLIAGIVSFSVINIFSLFFVLISQKNSAFSTSAALSASFFCSFCLIPKEKADTILVPAHFPI